MFLSVLSGNVIGVRRRNGGCCDLTSRDIDRRGPPSRVAPAERIGTAHNAQFADSACPGILDLAITTNMRGTDQHGGPFFIDAAARTIALARPAAATCRPRAPSVPILLPHCLLLIQCRRSTARSC